MVLTDSLGTLIDFSLVVLLLSLVSTALVQSTSSLLRLRGRNLVRGLARVLEVAMSDSDSDATTVRRASRDLARDVLDSETLVGMGRSLVPSWIPSWLRGPARTWIAKGDLAAAIEATNCGQITRDEIVRASTLFPQVENVMAKRFSYFMRMYSIVWAVVVAFVFQVSTPQLLRELSTDSSSRTSYLELVGADELKQAVEAAEQDAQKEGSKLEDLDARFAELELRVATLGQIDIRPWREGDGFYLSEAEKPGDCRPVEWASVGGVLMTAVLLSFGAPFWFNVLTKLAGMREKLAPADSKKDG